MSVENSKSKFKCQIDLAKENKISWGDLAIILDALTPNVTTMKNLISVLLEELRISLTNRNENHFQDPTIKNDITEGLDNDPNQYNCFMTKVVADQVESNNQESIKDLKTNQDAHNDVRRFECKTCGKRCREKSKLKEHERIHTKERPYLCKKCPKTFKATSHLLVHERIHDNDKRFECKTCGKRFIQSNELVVHFRIHTGEKPLKCTNCDKTFRNASQLSRHKLTHDKEDEKVVV